MFRNICFLVLLIHVFIATSPVDSQNKRSVHVYTGFPSDSSVQWLTDARSSVTGVYTCCGGYRVSADGTFVSRPSINITSLRQLGLEVIAVMGIDQVAVQSLSGLKAAAKISQVAYEQGLDGFVCDYEPSTNYTMAHVEAYASFLKAVSIEMHKKNLKFGLDIAGWGILGHSDVFAKTGVDIMTSMTPTYDGTDINKNEEYVISTLKTATSYEQVEIGFGTMLVDETKAKWNYHWTEEKFTSFVKWCATQGVESFALWRADIDHPLPANQTENYYFKALQDFLHPRDMRP